jgi:hypothetical protein
MGLLEDLGREAKLKQEDDRQKAARRADQLAYFRSTIRPRMAEVYGYLKELTNHLNYLKHETTVNYTIPRYAELKARLNPDYRMTISKDEDQVRIQLSLEAEITKDSAPVVKLEGQQILEDMESFLLERGLSAKESPRYNQAGEIVGATVQVFGVIKLRGIIQATVDSPDICFQFTNFDMLGTSSRQVKAEQIDEEFLDRLGRYVARDDDSYLRELLADGVRDNLREEIRRNERLRWAELSRERDPKPPPETGLGGRLMNHLRDLSHRLSSDHRNDKPE